MWQKLNYSYNGGEWNYKDIKPRIIIEKYLVDDLTKDIMDFRIFCFNGKPKEIHVDYSVKDNYSRVIFDTSWKKLNFDYAREDVLKKDIGKPHNLKKMIEYASILSKPFPFVRVDFYEINKKLIFSELTFFPSSGYSTFSPVEYDLKYGQRIKLPEKGQIIRY
jgi:hypothetical protein